MKSVSDKGRFDFLRSKSSFKIALLLIAGLVLIALGGLTERADSNTSKSSEEDSAAQMCAMVDGVGDCRIMMTYRNTDGESRVYAVAVFCDGADNAEVRSDVTELICSLYGIGAHRVKVVRLADNNLNE